MSDEQKPKGSGLVGMALRQARNGNVHKASDGPMEIEWVYGEWKDVGKMADQVKARFEQMAAQAEDVTLPAALPGKSIEITVHGLDDSAKRLQELRAKIEDPETWKKVLNDYLQQVDKDQP